MYIIFEYCGPAATSGNGVWQLAEDLRPKVSYNGNCTVVAENGTTNSVGLVIDTDGNIYHTSSTPRIRINGFACYDI